MESPRGYEQRDVGMTGLICDDLLTNLHEDPRWEPLLIKMRLLEYWMNIEQKKTSRLGAEERDGLSLFVGWRRLGISRHVRGSLTQHSTF